MIVKKILIIMAKKKNYKKNNPKRKSGDVNKDFQKPELMIGGQAVIEGVLMRTKQRYAVAVRKPDGSIVIKKARYISKTQQNKFLGLPFIRGIIILVETMILGYKALTFSAAQQVERLEEKERASKKSGGVQKKDSGVLGTFELIITFVFSIVFALLLFKFVPLLIASLLKERLGGSNLLFNLVDGLAKFIILVLYILAISLMKDVRRVFEYHGAEHKTVYCYEANKSLTLRNVRKESKAHPRCGTTFILVVILLSILFYLLIPFNMNFWLKLLIRVLFLPVIAGLAYEWIKISSKHPHRIYSRVLAAPGLLIQRLTTREPDNKQIEVAIRALKNVIKD